MSSPRGVGDARVAGDVDALGGAERDVDAAVGFDQRAGRRVLGVVLDHDDLRPVRFRLGGDGGERHGEVVAAVARGKDDRGGRGHGVCRVRGRVNGEHTVGPRGATRTPTWSTSG